MIKSENIKSFFQTDQIAVIGVSRKKNHFGDAVYETLKTKGLKVIPINPNTDKTQGGDVCYPNLKSIPNKIESAVILTSAKHTEDIVKEAIEYGIKNLWIQQKSDTKTAIELAEKNNINVIHHQCIMMFSEPVTGFHKFHKNIKKLFGALPK
jgi:uncharacterized protein